MSQSTSIVYGRGFEAEDLNFGNTLKFIFGHSKTLYNFENLKAEAVDNVVRAIDKLNLVEINSTEDIDGNEDLLDALSELTNNDIDWYALRDVIANIIAEETGLTIEFSISQEDCEGKASILLPELMPWSYNEKERALTEESFDEILKPYIIELGLNPDSIDDLKIEYYG